ITMCVVLQEAINQGKIEGEKIGENRFARLVQLLISSGRLDEIKKATEDSSYRHELYHHYKIL
ncbi:MAG: hypothetical protein ACLTBR_10930, partial [Anaerostipes sp.]